MADWRTRETADLQNLTSRLREVAPLTLGKLMDRAGMTTQSLSNWTSGHRTPTPESIEKVGSALLVHGDKLRELGNAFLKAARDEEAQRRSSRLPRSDNLSLFATDGTQSS